MKGNRVLISFFLILLLLAVFIFKRWREPAAREAFDRHPSQLSYTRHALCRMDCRHISKAEILEIMQRGIINLRMSHQNDKPCPTFALQGETDSGESLRVIFAQCGSNTKVVTCYNLKEHFECACPGDPGYER